MPDQATTIEALQRLQPHRPADSATYVERTIPARPPWNWPGRLALLPDTEKRPQMQWNRLTIDRPSQLFSTVDDPVWVYFVHSYAADAAGAHVVATCDYGGPVAAAIEHGLLWATQFHPEKSGGTGLQLLRAFVLAAQHGD